MKAQLHHLALVTRDFEETVRFFEDVFCMEAYRQEGEAPVRRIWFRQGIQINEDADASQGAGQYHHIGLAVDDLAEAVRKAKEYGCTTLLGKDKWLQTKDGLLIELMA